MKKHYDTILFDLDGTLLNTLGDLRAGVNHALKRYGYPLRTLSEVRDFIGNGIPTLIRRCLPQKGAEADFDAVLAAFYAHYRANIDRYTVPYDGIAPLLQELKRRGCRLGVVSNKNHREVEVLSKRFFGDTFDVAIGSSDTMPRKPAPNSVNAALAALGSEKARSLYVGDSQVDIETAKNAEIDLITVTWGYRDISFLIKSGAKTLIDRPEELLKVVSVGDDEGES